MKKLSYLACALLLVFALVRGARQALACGGPWVVAPEVVGLPRLPSSVIDPDEFPLPEDRFLYPFWTTHPQETQTLWAFAYEGLEQVDAPDSQPLERALAVKNAGQVAKLARRLIDDWYALPAPLAAPHRHLAFRAAKLLEPAHVGVSPTDEFLGIMAAFSSGVPNGWASSAKTTTAPGLWGEQLKATNDWLRNNPRHPLADLVTFWQVRVHYFAGDGAAAWSTLFKLYPRRRVRALEAMRYLLRQGQPPSDAQLDALQDPLLAAALVDYQIPTARWQRYWHLSEKVKSRAEATALQVRLLQALVANADTKAPLPEAFPSKAARPAQAWGELRAIVLIRRGRLNEAKEQLLLLDSDVGQATLLSNCYLALDKPVLAARVPQLGEVDIEYVTQVLVPVSELSRLKGAPEPGIRAQAEARIAAEAIRHDDFKTAAAWYKPSDAAQGADLERMAVLQQRHDDLGLARALKARGNQLGLGMTPQLYRGLSNRYAALKSGSAEAQGLIARFEGGSGSFQALRHYVPWLEAHANAANARAVLAEADAAYIALQSYGGWSGQFWDQYLTHHELAVRLRRVGKTIREGSKP